MNKTPRGILKNIEVDVEFDNEGAIGYISNTEIYQTLQSLAEWIESRKKKVIKASSYDNREEYEHEQCIASYNSALQDLKDEVIK